MTKKQKLKMCKEGTAACEQIAPLVAATTDNPFVLNQIARLLATAVAALDELAGIIDQDHQVET